MVMQQKVQRRRDIPSAPAPKGKALTVKGGEILRIESEWQRPGEPVVRADDRAAQLAHEYSAWRVALDSRMASVAKLQKSVNVVKLATRWSARKRALRPHQQVAGSTLVTPSSPPTSMHAFVASSVDDTSAKTEGQLVAQRTGAGAGTTGPGTGTGTGTGTGGGGATSIPEPSLPNYQLPPSSPGAQGQTRRLTGRSCTSPMTQAPPVKRGGAPSKTRSPGKARAQPPRAVSGSPGSAATLLESIIGWAKMPRPPAARSTSRSGKGRSRSVRQGVGTLRRAAFLAHDEVPTDPEASTIERLGSPARAEDEDPPAVSIPNPREIARGPGIVSRPEGGRGTTEGRASSSRRGRRPRPANLLPPLASPAQVAPPQPPRVSTRGRSIDQRGAASRQRDGECTTQCTGLVPSTTSGKGTARATTPGSGTMYLLGPSAQGGGHEGVETAMSPFSRVGTVPSRPPEPPSILRVGSWWSQQST
jgi:hypothetical protein